MIRKFVSIRTPDRWPVTVLLFIFFIVIGACSNHKAGNQSNNEKTTDSTLQGKAVRYYFSYNNGTITAVKKRSIAATALPSEPLTDYSNRNGFWVELSDASGKVLYRQLAPHPLKQDHETYSPGTSDIHTHEQFDNSSGTFELMLPDMPQATALRLAGDKVYNENKQVLHTVTGPAVELARFKVNDFKTVNANAVENFQNRNGRILGCKKIIDNGDPALRLNIVVLAEGYTDAEVEKFHQDVLTGIEYMFHTSPYDLGGIRNAINFYRVDIASTESGSSFPVTVGTQTCNQDGSTKLTYFNSKYCGRMISGDRSTVTSVCDSLVPGWHSALLLVNSTKHGGTSSGNICWSCTEENFASVFVHELGHNVFSLADEYEYYYGCGVDTDKDHYTGSEPGAENITAQTDRNLLKWNNFVSASTPIPTLANPDCSKCFDGTSPIADGQVGTFEGAGYYHCGLYRPEFKCMMRNAGYGIFCHVCEKRIRNVMKTYMIRYRPIPWFTFYDLGNDSWTPAFQQDDQLPVFPDNVYDIECAGSAGKMMVCLIDNTRLYVNLTNEQGKFNARFKNIDSLSSGMGGMVVYDVASAMVNNRFYVFAVSDGVLKYTVYYPLNGKWQASFQSVPGLGNVSSVSCTGVGTQLMVCVVSGGKVWQNVFYTASGQWRPTWTDVGLKSTGMPANIADLDCSSRGTQLDVIITSGSQLWLTYCNTLDGSWRPAFENITNKSAGLGIITEISCAAISNNLYITAINNGSPMYTMQNSAGGWNSSYKPISTLTVGPGALGCISSSELAGRLITCAGIQAPVAPKKSDQKPLQ